MLNTKKRGLLRGAGALVTAVALALGGAAAAQAAPIDSAPERTNLVITKLEQRDRGTEAATGLEQAVTAPRIAGVTFEAYQVPLANPALSNLGQQEMADMSLAEAKGKIGKSAERSGKTDDSGEVRWEGGTALNAGLWLIREANTPANVVPAGDFLVALPLTNPTDQQSWLDTVYVYPKNHTVTGTKSVKNSDALVVGQTVTWTIAVENPSPRDFATGDYLAAGKLEVTDVLKNDELSPVAGGIRVSVLKDILVADTDYTATIVDSADETKTVTVAFTEAGLEKLRKSPDAQAVIELDTLVNKAGSITNIAKFTTSDSEPKETFPAEIKYGDFSILKTSVGAPAKDKDKVELLGAQFMVFADEATAVAAMKGDAEARRNGLKPVNGGHDQGVWTTDAEGKFVIKGLRYSDHANGAVITDETKQQTYWLVETKALANHQLLTEPMPFKLTDTSKALEVENQYDRGGFVLPLTGGTGTLMLTIGGIALLAIVLIVARRRRNDVAAAE